MIDRRSELDAMIDRRSELDALMMAHVNHIMATNPEVQMIARMPPRPGAGPEDGGSEHAAYMRACELAEQVPAVIALQQQIAAHEQAYTTL